MGWRVRNSGFCLLPAGLFVCLLALICGRRGQVDMWKDGVSEGVGGLSVTAGVEATGRNREGQCRRDGKKREGQGLISCFSTHITSSGPGCRPDTIRRHPSSGLGKSRMAAGNKHP